MHFIRIKSCFKENKHEQQKSNLKTFYKNEIRKHFKDNEYDSKSNHLSVE